MSQPYDLVELADALEAYSKPHATVERKNNGNQCD